MEGDLKVRAFDPANYLKSQNDMQEFLTLSIKSRIREKDKEGLCRAFGVIVRASGLNNPERKEQLTAFSEPLLQEGTPEALRKIAHVLGLKVPASFGKPMKRQKKAHVAYTNLTPKETYQPHVHVG